MWMKLLRAIFYRFGDASRVELGITRTTKLVCFLFGHDWTGYIRGFKGVRSQECFRCKKILVIQQGFEDGMPEDREALQKLLNKAYRKGNQDAHDAFRVLQEVGLETRLVVQVDFVRAVNAAHRPSDPQDPHRVYDRIYDESVYYLECLGRRQGMETPIENRRRM